MIRPSEKLTLTTSTSAIAPPSGQHRILDSAWVANPTAALIFVRILEDGVVIYNDAVGANTSAKVDYRYVSTGSLTATASTSDDGTGAPIASIQFTPRWSR